MRRKTYYMAVQVVERHEDGSLKLWYDGEPRGHVSEAREDAKENAELYPDTPFQVIEKTYMEIGKEWRAEPVAKARKLA